MSSDMVVGQNIIISGYFDQKNLGDDLFKSLWIHIFSKNGFHHHKTKFITIDNLSSCTDIKDCDILILAGGDVLNYYFLDILKHVVHKHKFCGKLYAFSVGIPYPIVVVDGLLDNFNFIMCRAKGDAFNLRRRFGESHVRYFPDLSVYLPELFHMQKSKHEFEGISKHKVYGKRLNVGVFLTRNIYGKNIHYDTIIQKFSKVLDDLCDQTFPGICGFEFFLIPFDTNEHKVFENDRLINKDVYDLVKHKDKIHNVDRYIGIEEMWWTFKNQLDMNITMRYHSHMYSIMSRVPFVSIHTSRKVQNLLVDCDLKCYGYKFPLDENDMPTDFDTNLFKEKFTLAFNDRMLITNNMKSYVDKHANIDQFEKTLKTLVEDPIEKVSIQSRTYPLITIVAVIESLIKYIWNEEGKVFNDKDVALVADDIYKAKMTFATLVRDRLNDSKAKMKLEDFLASLACFGLIRIPYPKYHFGMSKKILRSDFQARSEFMWVWSDYQKDNEKFFLEYPIIRKAYYNATFVGIEDFKGCHRSGWQYVLNNLMGFHSDTSQLIFDNYVDRTFHWAHDVYRYTKIIPFRKQWCGFVHHTFDESYSPFNVLEMFRKPTFLESLNTCFALFTLSHNLGMKIKVLLQQHGFNNVHVATFTHPTETPTLIFSIDRFLENEQRKVVQIGAWLRDSYAIYDLNIDKVRIVPNNERISLRKTVLKGRNMDNYFKPDGFKLVFDNTEIGGESFEYLFKKGIVQSSKNKFISGLLSKISDSWNSVDIIDTLDNTSYDILLSENIVFLKLVDASAVNTIIECIVRSTPILVNRIPAVVEMLGMDYPFYYDTMTEASLKVNDLDLIKATNKYLTNLDKEKFTMKYFLSDIDTWFKEHL